MKKIYVAIIACLFSGLIMGQTQNRHELSINAAGGLSTFMPHSTFINNQVGWGGQLGLSYDYFINYNWSIGIGGEFSAINLWNGRQSISGVNLNDYYDYFLDGAFMRFRSEALKDYNYSQRTKGFYVNIPIIARYHHDISEKGHRMLVGFGFKLGVPLNVMSSYVSSGALRLSGVEIDEFNEPITQDWYGANLDDLREIGGINYGKRVFNDEKSKLNLNINLAATVDFGFKWKISRVFSIYTGVYLDYGLIDVNAKRGRIYDIDRNSELGADGAVIFTPTAIFGAQYDKPGKQLDVDKALNLSKFTNTISCGLKIAFTFGFKPVIDRPVKDEVLVDDLVEDDLIEEPVAEKPYEGLTEEQMKRIMDDNTQKMNDFNKKELDEIKKLIKENSDAEPLGDIHAFLISSAAIEDQMKPTLEKVYDLLQKNPSLKILLVGHTCELGDNIKNHDLGLRRADAAKTYLVKKGISADRLFIDSKGSTCRKVENDDEASRLINRRVEFIPLKTTK
jgi:outer membrane protein OmpA-like peptidoglycan-associated protein